MDVRMDSPKLFQISSHVFWTTLGSIVDFSNEMQFTIECFSGTEKPWNINNILKEFCEEVSYLQEKGLQLVLILLKKNLTCVYFAAILPQELLL